MAKLVRRVTSNDEIVGSNPARGIYFYIFLEIKIYYCYWLRSRNCVQYGINKPRSLCRCRVVRATKFTYPIGDRVGLNPKPATTSAWHIRWKNETLRVRGTNQILLLSILVMLMAFWFNPTLRHYDNDSEACVKLRRMFASQWVRGQWIDLGLLLGMGLFSSFWNLTSLRDPPLLRLTITPRITLCPAFIR